MEILLNLTAPTAGIQEQENKAATYALYRLTCDRCGSSSLEQYKVARALMIAPTFDIATALMIRFEAWCQWYLNEYPRDCWSTLDDIANGLRQCGETELAEMVHGIFDQQDGSLTPEARELWRDSIAWTNQQQGSTVNCN